MTLPTDAELGEAMQVAKRVARKFALRVGKSYRMDDYEGSALEAVAKAYLSWDDALGVPFTAWAARRAQGAVIDEHRRWNGRGPKMHDEPLSLDMEPGVDSYLEHYGAAPSAESAAVARDEARRVIAALDAFDKSKPRRRPKVAPSTCSVLLGSAIGESFMDLAAGTVSESRISQIRTAGRAVVTEVMAS